MTRKYPSRALQVRFVPRSAVTFACALATSLTAALPTLLSAQGATRPAAPATSGPEVFIVPISTASGALKIGVPANLTRRDGYDNQPSFSAASREIYYTSNRGDGQTDVYRYDLSTGLSSPIRRTNPESEYSAFAIDSGKAVAVIRVEADSTQRLWRLPFDDSPPTVLFPDIKPVGYFAQADDSTWAMFVLGSPNSLVIATRGRTGNTVVARNIGRSLHRIPGTTRVSYVQKGADAWYVMQLDPATKRVDTLVKTLPRVEDLAWIDGETIVMGQGTKLFAWKRGATE